MPECGKKVLAPDIQKEVDYENTIDFNNCDLGCGRFDFGSGYSIKSECSNRYDANLKAGDMAVGVVSGTYLESVRIESKSNGVYKTVDQDDGETIYLLPTQFTLISTYGNSARS